MSSRPEDSSSHRPAHGDRPPAAGAGRPAGPRAARRAHGHVPQPDAHYEPYLDGLFTYCLSVLCDHDAAVAALGDALAIADRHRDRLRDPGLRRSWLYALARWACLRRLALMSCAATPAERYERLSAVDLPVGPGEPSADERRRELAALAWPEAAGTTPEQREAIELAVRHQLTEREIAAVLAVDRDTARTLISRAACAIERTRTALAVVELGSCPAVARLAGETTALIGTALRRELVRHVDECRACRLTAERAVAGGPWPGTPTPAVLSVVEAPRPAVHAATLHSQRAIRVARRDHRPGHRLVPRFDRHGFPLDDRERATRRALIRHRAVTTTVVAAVVAAPALALWAAYRGASQTGPGQDASKVSAAESGDPDHYTYERTDIPHRFAAHPSRSDGDEGRGPTSAASADGARGGRPSASNTGTPPSGSASAGPSASAPGRLTIAAHPQGHDTVVTLTNDGGRPLRWSASTTAAWLRPSAASGELRPGESTTITVSVDRAAEPAGHWRGRVVFQPSGTVLTVEGEGRTPPAPPTPTAAPAPSQAPSSQSAQPSRSGPGRS